MQQAYSQANDIVSLATQQAQEILDNAMLEANNMKSAAIQYTYDILGNVENIIEHSIDTATNHYEKLVLSLKNCDDIVKANRAELIPMEEEASEDLLSENSDQINLDIL